MQKLSREIQQYIDRHRVARLATADAAGVPHVVPLCYARVGEHLYFVADDKPKRRAPHRLKRLANIAANPQVALLIDDYDDDWQKLSYLLLQCEATVVSEPREYAAALAALRERYAPYQHMPLAIATHPLVRMRPWRAHLWRAARALNDETVD